MSTPGMSMAPKIQYQRFAQALQQRCQGVPSNPTAVQKVSAFTSKMRTPSINEHLQRILMTFKQRGGNYHQTFSTFFQTTSNYIDRSEFGRALQFQLGVASLLP